MMSIIDCEIFRHGAPVHTARIDIRSLVDDTIHILYCSGNNPDLNESEKFG